MRKPEANHIIGSHDGVVFRGPQYSGKTERCIRRFAAVLDSPANGSRFWCGAPLDSNPDGRNLTAPSTASAVRAACFSVMRASRSRDSLGGVVKSGRSLRSLPHT